MPCLNLAASSQLLYRIFVSSASANNLSISQRGQVLRHKYIFTSLFLPPYLTQTYRAAAYRPTKATPRIEQAHVVDEAIQSKYVHLIVGDGTQFPPHQPVAGILHDLDRETYHLVQVASTSPSGYPVVKVISKRALREAQDEKLRRPQKSVKKTSKQLELGWAIDGNDLAHRLKKLGQFLGEGRRVEVLMANKRKARKATMEEAEQLVAKVRHTAMGIPGVKEAAEMEGKPGGKAILVFQPPKKAKSKYALEEDEIDAQEQTNGQAQELSVPLVAAG